MRTPPTERALRLLADAPVQCALSEAADMLLRIVIQLAHIYYGARPTIQVGPQAGSLGRRWVSLVDVREYTDDLLLQRAWVDRGLRELADVYQVWLRTEVSSSAQDDDAAVLYRGNSCHRVTADRWR